jgi:acyl-CoA reductase-like NAD-dependent aldehyde dehydrogenase
MLIGSFINNEIYDSPARGSGSSYSSFSPYTGEKLHEVWSANALNLVQAVQAGNRAAAEWKDSALSERLALVRNLQSALEAKAEQYARLESEQQGLPLQFVKTAGLQTIIQSIEDRALEVYELLQPEQYSPVGLVAIVASWNLSLRVIFDRMLPALLAGNAVIIKVSSASPVTAWIIADLCRAAFVPAGLVNVVVSGDADFKKMLIAHPGIKAVSLCGSHDTAVSVIQEIGRNTSQVFKKLQVSAGSKNSAIALSEPTDEVFFQVMQSFMLGQGQLVWNSARLFVSEKYETLWRERIQDYLQKLRPAESVEDDSLWTPCLKQSSYACFDEIRQTASADQAKLIQSEYPLTVEQKKRYLPPTFTQDMSRCSTLQQDQVHAPFYILSAVKYAFDVPKYSNVSYYGFSAHAWGDREKLEKIGRALDVGQVCFNKFSAFVPGSLAGVKQSGYGLQDDRVFGAFFSNVKKLSE